MRTDQTPLELSSTIKPHPLAHSCSGITQTLGWKIDKDHLGTLLRALKTQTLEEVAASPLVTVPFAGLRTKIEEGLEAIRSSMRVSDDGIGMYELTATEEMRIPRFGSFLIDPSIKYMVSLIHGEQGSKISASRNPWGGETIAPLGTIFRSHGGGGHHNVGSYQMPLGKAAEARATFREIVLDIRAAERGQSPNTKNLGRTA